MTVRSNNSREQTLDIIKHFPENREKEDNKETKRLRKVKRKIKTDN